MEEETRLFQTQHTSTKNIEKQSYICSKNIISTYTYEYLPIYVWLQTGIGRGDKTI